MVVFSERQSARYAIDTDCMVVAERGSRWLGDKVVDLSWDGAFVRCDAAVELGERVKLSIRLPHSRVWVEAEGRVARIARGRRGGGDVTGIGVRLARMDGMSRLLMASVLRSFPSPAPHRGARRDYARIVERIDRES